jgi:hypothetical protein
VAVLVDFDNVVVGPVPDAPQMSSLLSRIIGIALDLWPVTDRIEVSLYGGWLDDGVLARRGSAVQASVAASPFFPLPHPSGPGLLRGTVQLATRIAAVPEIEWQHTLRERRGLPRVRFRDGSYPRACTKRSSECPLKEMRRFSDSHGRSCGVAGCDVTNEQAFRTPEQKMVDVMIACDALAICMTGKPALVMCSDLDVLPAVAMAAKQGAPGCIALWQVARYSADLYLDELQALGVAVGSWEGK